MNCAKCATPSVVRKNQLKFRLSATVKLVKIGQQDGYYRMECPQCLAKYWFPVPSEKLAYANAD